MALHVFDFMTTHAHLYLSLRQRICERHCSAELLNTEQSHWKRRTACAVRRFIAGGLPAVEMGLSGVRTGTGGVSCNSSARRTSMRARALPRSVDLLMPLVIRVFGVRVRRVLAVGTVCRRAFVFTAGCHRFTAVLQRTCATTTTLRGCSRSWRRPRRATGCLKCTSRTASLHLRLRLRLHLDRHIDLELDLDRHPAMVCRRSAATALR